ncbi:MAG: hypothetical protein E6303_00455 [Clostridium perfringens]|nr:hypothetical protein [Clostridium perfringens]
MAMNDNYRLNISGDSSQLESSLKIIQAYMDAIENMELDKPIDGMADKLKIIASQFKRIKDIADKTDGSAFISSKDMNTVVDSTRKATKEINDFKDAISDAQKEQIAMGKAPNTNLQKSYEKLNNTLESMTENLDEFSSKTVGTDSGINTRIQDMKRLGEATDDYYESLNNAMTAQQKMKQIRASEYRVRRNLDKSEISGRMSYDTGTQTKSAIGKSQFMRRDSADLKKQLADLRNRDKNDTSMSNLNRRFTNKEIDKSTYQQERAQIEANNKARAKEIDSIEKLIRQMDTTSNYFDNVASKQMNDRRIDPARGTFKGIFRERAPSIASHGVMAGMAVGGGMYMKGKSLSETNRPQKIALGQQMGTSDYKSVRHNFEEMSIDNHLGYNSTDMLKFASDYMGSVGYKGQDNVNSGVKELATGGKAMGIADDQAYRDSMNTLMHTGAIDSGADIKDIQSAFLGGLKESGMVGRNEEQLKALSSIAESVGQGRTMTKNDLSNVSSMQSMLASSGSKGLQGQQGAEFMSSLNDGIRNGMQDPYIRNAMGWGSQYQGLEGRYDLQKRMDKGIADPENVSDLYQQATQVSSSKKGQKIAFNESLKQMGVDATLEQSDELFKMAEEGKLTKKALEDYKKKTSKEGSKERDKNSKDYKESQEGKDDQGKAKADRLAENLYDMTGKIRNVNTALMSLPAPFYLAGASAMAFAVSLMKSIAMMKGSEMLGRRANGESLLGRRGRGKGRNGRAGGRRGRTDNGSGTPIGGGGSPKKPNGDGGGTFHKGSTGRKGGRLGRVGDFGKRLIQVGEYKPTDTSRGGQIKGLGDLGKKIKGGTTRAGEGIKGIDWKGLGNNAKNIGRGVVSKGRGIDWKGIGSNAKTTGKGIVSKGKGLLSKIPKGKGGTSGITAGARGLKGLGKGIPLLGLGISALDIGSSLKSGNKEAIGGSIGGATGATAGGAIGATIGSVIPGLGTAIGGIAGSTIGGIVGDKAGSEVGKKGLKKSLGIGWTKPKSYKDFGLVGKAWHGLFGSKKGKNKNIPTNDPTKIGFLGGAGKGGMGSPSDDKVKRNPALISMAPQLSHQGLSEFEKEGDKENKKGISGFRGNDCYKQIALLVA